MRQAVTAPAQAAVAHATHALAQVVCDVLWVLSQALTQPGFLQAAAHWLYWSSAALSHDVAAAAQPARPAHPPALLDEDEPFEVVEWLVVAPPLDVVAPVVALEPANPLDVVAVVALAAPPPSEE
jgi:hypothetical protein